MSLKFYNVFKNDVKDSFSKQIIFEMNWNRVSLG